MSGAGIIIFSVSRSRNRQQSSRRTRRLPRPTRRSIPKGPRWAFSRLRFHPPSAFSSGRTPGVGFCLSFRTTRNTTMPKFSIDLFVKAQVIEAYRSLDDLNHQQKEINGSVIRRTRIIIENIITWRKETDYWELRMYYQIGEQWAEEVNEVHGNI